MKPYTITIICIYLRGILAKLREELSESVRRWVFLKFIFSVTRRFELFYAIQNKTNYCRRPKSYFAQFESREKNYAISKIKSVITLIHYKVSLSDTGRKRIWK